MDAIIGELISTLKKIGQYDNTLIFFLSDNGAWVNPSNGLGDDSVSPLDGGSNAPFQGGKGDTWKGGLRVPAILKVSACGEERRDPKHSAYQQPSSAHCSSLSPPLRNLVRHESLFAIPFRPSTSCRPFSTTLGSTCSRELLTMASLFALLSKRAE